jgi:DNA-binding response OmpR family regulator
MSSCRILYVDDNNDSRELAAVMFNYSDTGCNVISAESAEEALRLIDKEPFDAYIFDNRLPKMSGIELCRYIRQFDADTPILFFSALARPNEVAEALEAGASDYLVKPNDLERLPETVKQFLSEDSTALKTEPATVRAGF